MVQLLIRNLDPAVVDVLKRRAATNRRSLAEEVRRTLTAAAGFDRAAALARIDAVRAEIGPVQGPSAVEEIRAMRDRDHAKC